MNLFDIPLIATAISIVISWALFAIFCSLLNELFMQLKSERGRYMRNFLFDQLRDYPNGINWATLLYMHGPVDMLSKSPSRPTAEIPPRLFAESIVEVISQSETVKMKLAQTAVVSTFQNDLLKKMDQAVQVLQPSDVVSFFKHALQTAEAQATAVGIDREAHIYQQVVIQMENWFQSLMGQLNDAFRRKTRRHLLWIGLILGVLINVDSVQLFRYFNSTPQARTAMMNFYEKNGEVLADYARKLDSAGVSAGDTTRIPALTGELKAYTHQLDSLSKQAQLPVGFDYSVFEEKPANTWLKILGILLTGFAASFGAPFWFDLLKKIYTVKR